MLACDAVVDAVIGEAPTLNVKDLWEAPVEPKRAVWYRGDRQGRQPGLPVMS
ncbi:MAG: hypothetical protein HY937_03395 [Nitrosomonadales bacterium]|nr:hypothetical protein [Nitrosomonadales bacterium]